MAEPFLSLTTRERADILRSAAADGGRPALVLEKDIWVCWVLQVLFSMSAPHSMAFKGGTSLSKVYGIIERFSEDVDVTLDYRDFHDDFDPFAEGVSRNAIRKFSNRLRNRVACFVRDFVSPALNAAATELGDIGHYEIHVGETDEVIHFAYPSALEAPGSYVASEVLLEFGGRNIIDPNECHTIVPDIAALVDGLEFPEAIVTVHSPERTFWEKATLIHVECHRHRLATSPHRLSRHWFDLACLARHDSGRKALVNRDLLEDVVRHKKVFFNASYAHYDHCLDGRLRLVPDDDDLVGLRSDYNDMCQAGLIGATAPRYDDLFDQLRALEIRANRSLPC